MVLIVTFHCVFVCVCVGMPVINEGVAQLSSAQEGWTDVFVDIASSHIKILDRNVT